MSYQVLARKWRPQVFEEVVGQQAITRTLRNAIETGRLHHAYLFSGARGVGKTTTARLLAKALNCHKQEGPNPVPCITTSEGACVSCLEVAESRSMDVLEFDAASHTKVEEIREIILESININPARDRYKVFIIDEVHMLSKSSFNALLKTLEEPPSNVVFIMATTELHKVPDTILSRCQEFEFRTIPLKKILERLEEIAGAEGVDITAEALKEIARSGEGSMRDAQSNFDQVISFSGEKIGVEEVSAALGIAGTENLERTIRAIANRDSEEMLKVVDDLVARGHDLRNYCRDLMAFVRDLLVFKIAGDAHGLLDTAILSAEEMKEHAAPFLEADLIRFFNSLAETEAALRDAAEPRFVLEIGLVKLSEMRRVTAIEDLIKRIESLGASATGTAARAASAEAAIEESPAEPEKKTLEIDIEAAETSEPSAEHVRRADPPEDAEPAEDATELVRAEIPDDVAYDRLMIDPDSMPVKLPPIASEDLEHVEDAWLDSAYERVLESEGDDSSPLADPARIINQLLGDLSEDAEEDDRRSEADERANNLAVAIAEEMTASSSEPSEMPTLPDNPTPEQLREFAENHPLVRHAKRLFRGEIVDVNIDP